MSDTHDFSNFGRSNTAEPDPVDPSSYSQSYTSQTRQHGDAYGGHRSSSANGAAGESSSTARENSDYSSFTFGQPSTSAQTGSQEAGYYGMNGVDDSQTSYTTADAGAYTPIDPALTATRGGQ